MNSAGTSRTRAASTVVLWVGVAVATGACFGRSDSKPGAGASFDAGSDVVSFDSGGPQDDGAAPLDAPAEVSAEASQEAGTVDLGRVWHEVEEAGNCDGLWTRQGTTSTFDSVWANCGGTTALITISIVGTSVTAQRTMDSGGNDCTYTGTLSADGLSVTGTYTCMRYQPPPPGAWSATIDLGVPDGGGDASPDASVDAPAGG